MRKHSWDAMRRAYEQEGLSCRQIAQRFGVGYSTVTEHARRESWQVGGQTALPQLVARLSDTVLAALENVRGAETPDIKAVKDLTAMLRDLANLDKALESRQAEDTVLRVELAPEIEEWSR